MVKLTGSRHSGYHQNSAGHHTLAATGRNIAHRQILLALTLRHIGGRTALIELYRRHTAQSNHHLGLFLGGIAHGAGRHSTVGLEQNHGAVSLDTHTSTGIVAAVTGLGANYLAVPDHGHQGVYSLHNFNGFALLGALVGLGLSQSRALPEHIDRAVVKGCDIGAPGIIVVHHTVHYQIARGLAGVHIEPRGVDATNNVQAALFFINMRLISGGLQSPPLFLGVAVTVTCHDLCSTTGGIYLHDVGNRLRVTGGIVGHDDPLGDVWCDRIVLQ